MTKIDGSTPAEDEAQALKINRSELHPEHLRLIDGMAEDVLISYEDDDGNVWHIGYEVDRTDLERGAVWVTVYELGGPPDEIPSMREIEQDVLFGEHCTVALEHARWNSRSDAS